MAPSPPARPPGQSAACALADALGGHVRANEVVVLVVVTFDGVDQDGPAFGVDSIVVADGDADPLITPGVVCAGLSSVIDMIHATACGVDS